MNLSSNKLTNDNFLKRLDQLVPRHGGNRASFLRNCGLSGSIFHTMSKRPEGYPSGQVIESVIVSTGCNAHWLITGEGEMYVTRENIGHDEVAEPNISDLLREAEQIFSYLENSINAGEVFELDPDLRVQLQKLLLKDAELRQKR